MVIRGSKNGKGQIANLATDKSPQSHGDSHLELILVTWGRRPDFKPLVGWANSVAYSGYGLGRFFFLSLAENPKKSQKKNPWSSMFSKESA